MEISVVTAVYNGEAYLTEAVESILNQSCGDFEYVIVNDGSRDGTKEILDGLDDPRVRVIHLEQNSGAANALNRGIKAARGRWIALQDADDVSEGQRLQRQWEFAGASPGVVAVGSLVRCIAGADPISEGELCWEEGFFNEKDHFKDYQFYSTPLCHGSGFFLKRACEKIGGYDPAFRIAYDYDFWTRLFEEGEITRVPEALYRYRLHRRSLAHNNKLETAKELLLSTFKCLSLLRYKYLGRMPRLALLGLKSHLHFYREELARRNRYLDLVPFALDLENLTRAAGLYRCGSIDGVIVTVNQQIDKVIRYFQESGLSFGMNLFMVWMPTRQPGR